MTKRKMTNSSSMLNHVCQSKVLNRMNAYICENCPLAFEVGWYGYWDLPGGCVTYVCSHCGTMHKIEHLEQQPDMLYAVDGPTREMVEEPLNTCDGLRLPISAWRLVGPLPTAAVFLKGWFILLTRAQAVALDQVTCAHCERVGGLVSLEWPLTPAGEPVLRENCPVCMGTLRFMYLDIIN